MMQRIDLRAPMPALVGGAREELAKSIPKEQIMANFA
jgi:hypothetical protein